MSIVRKLALLVTSAVIAFVLLEGALRLFAALAPTPADSAYLPDPHCGYRLRPHPEALRREHPDDFINSFGFRDAEHPVTKPPRTWRILGLGDSFVYGAVPPRDNFLRVAARHLEPQLAVDSLRPEMIMMGIGAYSTENELGVLRSIGLDLDPDCVVLCFFVGNDVTGIPLRGQVVRGNLYWTGAASPLHDMLRSSMAYRMTEMFATMRIKWPIQKALAARRERALLAPTGAAAETLSTHPPSMRPYPPLNSVYLEFTSRRLPVYARDSSRRTESLWREAEAALAEVDRTCEAANTPWILVAIPDEIQVDADVQRAALEALEEDPSRYDFDLPQRRLAAFARAHDVPCLDLAPALRAAHRAEARLYIPNDTHWNAAGNRVAGEALAAFLAAEGRSAGAAADPPMSGTTP